MLKIGICSKRTDFEKYVEDLLGGILWEYGDWSIEAIPYKALVDQQREQFIEYHIFCIDEQLLEEYGIHPVAHLSRIRPDATIILLEGIEEQGITGIRYHLFTYQMKRMKQQELQAELNRQWQYANSKSRCLSVEIDEHCISVPLEQIVYIESSNHRVILHTVFGDYIYYEKMYVLEELLKEDGFVRCHQSYIVSKRFVMDYTRTEIQLEHNTIPIGRKYIEQVYRAFEREADILADDVQTDKLSEKQGALVGKTGVCRGITIHFRPEQRILVGRDDTVADVVIARPTVSRLHCVIIFHEKDNTYEIVDFSKNGTYISDKQRLVPDTAYCVNAGTKISFGDMDNIYYLA